MKRFIVFLLTIYIVLPLSLIAQESKDQIRTEQFKVAGNCEMCKKRIEDAAYGKGVKTAEWNKTTGELQLTYRSSKTDAPTILKRVAAAGHDADTFTADHGVYHKLPACCSYRTNAHQH